MGRTQTFAWMRCRPSTRKRCCARPSPMSRCARRPAAIANSRHPWLASCHLHVFVTEAESMATVYPQPAICARRSPTRVQETARCPIVQHIHTMILRKKKKKKKKKALYLHSGG